MRKTVGMYNESNEDEGNAAGQLRPHLHLHEYKYTKYKIWNTNVQKYKMPNAEILKIKKYV